MGGAVDIANRGQIRFYRKSPSSCAVKLTISYELPDVLVPFGNVSRRFVCLCMIHPDEYIYVCAENSHILL